MKTFVLWGLLLGLLISHQLSHAQAYPCSGPGPGEVVVGQTPGGQGVASMQLCQRAATQQQQPPVRWESRWGAIATDAPHAVLGTSTGQKSQASAERAATNDCMAKGGQNCVLQISYANTCAALAVSSKSTGTASRVGLADAEKAATKACQDGGGSDCRIYYSSCTQSQPIQ
ncbi:DUF4189 domain-containing protein [Glaciimonas soli]|uniref:DUF4189 domain-containing protein n=1 Tax=Glaciimonas soli TaxID=2590999 RepID=A0A843YQM4_9BURK|nr:DUF4189 domain-containing protein [Glaciimonas soli]